MMEVQVKRAFISYFFVTKKKKNGQALLDFFFNPIQVYSKYLNPLFQNQRTLILSFPLFHFFKEYLKPQDKEYLKPQDKQFGKRTYRLLQFQGYIFSYIYKHLRVLSVSPKRLLNFLLQTCFSVTVKCICEPKNLI